MSAENDCGQEGGGRRKIFTRRNFLIGAGGLVGVSFASYLWPRNQADIPVVADINLGALNGNKKVIRNSGRKYLEELFGGIPKSPTNPGREG